MSVRFEFDWVGAALCPDVADRRTMAKLSIRAGSATVTSVLDKQRRSYRDHVVVPMFQVAEWIVTNWWHIWYEIQDTRQQRPGFAARHDLAFACEGFVLPHLNIVPLSGRVQLQWERWKPDHSRVEFVEESRMEAGREEVEAEFRNIVESVIDRMSGFEECETALESLGSAWDAINSADEDELEFSRAAALLGIDPFDVGDLEAHDIAAFWDRFDPAIRDDALASASEDALTATGEWLADVFRRLEDMQSEHEWAAIRRAVARVLSGEPWEQGCELARSARKELGASDGRFDFDSYQAPPLIHSFVDSPSNRIEGLVAANAPNCVTVQKPEPGKWFLVARALGDYLSRAEPCLGILSSLATDRQARSRAFAAEFLAPAESLMARLDGKTADEYVVDELGSEFGVSSYVIRHQIQNHNLATLYLDEAVVR